MRAIRKGNVYVARNAECTLRRKIISCNRKKDVIYYECKLLGEKEYCGMEHVRTYEEFLAENK